MMYQDKKGKHSNKKVTENFSTWGYESTIPEIWKDFMHQYGHGVWEKSVLYHLQNVIELVSTGTPFTPH